MKKVFKRTLRNLFVQISLLWIKVTARQTVITCNDILVLSPHPDDEIIGLGGFIVKVLGGGGKVHIVYLTDGESSCSFSDEERVKQERFVLTNNVLSELKIPHEQVFRLHQKDGGVPQKGDKSFSELVDQIAEIIEETKPDAVFATHFLDRHLDHVACSELAKEAVEKANHKSSLWFYWVWTWHFLLPWQLFKTRKAQKIDISSQFKNKKELMDLYLIPKSPINIPWSGNLPKSMLYPFYNKPYEIVEKYKC